MAIVGSIVGSVSNLIPGLITSPKPPFGAAGGSSGGGFGATDMSTLTAVESFTFTVRSYQSIPLGLWFKADGTKVALSGQGGKTLTIYTIPTPFDVSTIVAVPTFSGQTLDDFAPTGLTMSDDGLRAWIVGNSGERIDEYSLSVAWDASTISLNNVSTYDMTADGISDPINVQFNEDGSKMYIQELPANYKISEFALATEFDVSTASFTAEYDYATDSGSDYSNGFFINGTEIYTNTQQDKIHKWTWDGSDITTMTYVGSQSYTQGQLGQRELWMNADYVAYVDSSGADQIHVHEWGPH